MNMAGTVNLTWANAGAKQLSLVDVACHNVRENERLEKTVERFLEGSFKSTGKRPSGKEVERRLRERLLQRARLYGKKF